ncbi:MAG TPA: hypothetical protein VIV58_36500 [Kofleriaceae bacterium]
MRSALLCSILLCACAADHADGSGVATLQPPTACAQSQLSFVTDLPGALNTEASVAMSGYAFANASIQYPGELIVYPPESAQGTPQVHLYFTKLALDDATVPARGVVVMPDQNIEAANCMTDALQGAITVGSNGVYSFMVTGLKTGADCSGARITGSFAGCFATQP